ncbi:hypothetical protein FA95DRAFT_614898 [Auriscalpium vulgare]|uniref:Uncharacterized protein n=1 Tax=Auriscalpium vulgare TaxID=40419 RepID=A0ACB8RDW8_9AGAM|nr:hypothetical protein FA95DRAFT_614898 [Auriscalpium vulgare]
MSTRPSIMRQNASNENTEEGRSRSLVAQLSELSSLQTAYTHVPAALATTAAVLKEVGEMGTKLPMLKGPAGILLRVLEIYNEVLAYREQREEVKKTLERVGWLMLDTAKYCQLSGFSTMAELPADLGDAMSSIVKVLHEVNSTLSEYEGQTKLRQTIARTTISSKLVSCDRKIQAILEASNFSLTFTVLSKSAYDSNISRKASLGIDAIPTKPQVFHGRDAELSAVVSDIMSGSPPARVAILGPGGIGKTTLAVAALHHPQTLKLGLDNIIALQQAIIAHLSNSGHCIICFDNFETPWEEDRHAVETFVGLLSALPSVTLLVTMRGSEEPDYIAWTEVQVLDIMDAQTAQKTFRQICGQWDEWAAKLMEAVDCLPLAVTLLANLAQTTSTEELWTQWKLNTVASIERAKGHRLTSLEVSICMSINGVRMQSNTSTLQLLSILCQLPRGLNINRVAEFAAHLVMPDIEQNVQILKECSLAYFSSDNFLSTHSLIRHYCQKYHPVCTTDKDALKDYYVELSLKDTTGKPDLHIEQLTESGNLCEVLSLVLQDDSSLIEHKVIQASLFFSKLLGRQGVYCGILLQLLEKRRDTLLPAMQIRFLLTWGNCLRMTDDFEMCMEKYTLALSLALKWTVTEEEGRAYGFIGEVYYLRGLRREGKIYFKKAYKVHRTLDDVKQQVASLNYLSRICGNDNDWYKAKQYIHSSLKLQQQLQGSSLLQEAHCWKTLAEILSIEENWADAEASYMKALTLYRQDNCIEGEILAICCLGDNWFLQNEVSTAKRYFQQSVSLAEGTGHNTSLSYGMSRLANCYYIEQDYEKACEYYRKSISLYKAQRAPYGLWITFREISKLYEEQGLIDDAIFCLIQACQLHDALKDWILDACNDYDRLAKLYNMQSKYKLAKDAILKSVQLHNSLNDEEGTAEALYELGLVYNDLNEDEEAERHLYESMSISKKINSSRHILDSFIGLVDVYDASRGGPLANHRRAIQCCLRAVRLSEVVDPSKTLGTKLFCLCRLEKLYTTMGEMV